VLQLLHEVRVGRGREEAFGVEGISVAILAHVLVAVVLAPEPEEVRLFLEAIPILQDAVLAQVAKDAEVILVVRLYLCFVHHMTCVAPDPLTAYIGVHFFQL
jgi:phosphatidylserine/phosphatidylglycerophosphate/cardiolipin synthase-like enzyme